jgi:hypothetical protein
MVLAKTPNNNAAAEIAALLALPEKPHQLLQAEADVRAARDSMAEARQLYRQACTVAREAGTNIASAEMIATERALKTAEAKVKKVSLVLDGWRADFAAANKQDLNTSHISELITAALEPVSEVLTALQRRAEFDANNGLEAAALPFTEVSRANYLLSDLKRVLAPLAGGKPNGRGNGAAKKEKAGFEWADIQVGPVGSLRTTKPKAES